VSEQIIDYSRKWYVMATVAMGIFLSTIDGTIINVALPTLVSDLNADFPTVQWVMLSYLLTLAILLLTMGRLGDMVGKKPIYALGMVIFTTGSVLCGLSPTVYWLIGFRVLQAIGASMTMALGTAILAEAFPPTERGQAMGISGTMVAIGIVTGPVLGGIIVDALSWHWIFLVNVPVGCAGIFMVLRYVQGTRPAGNQRFDFLGAGTLLSSLLCLLLALTIGQRIGFVQGPILALLAAWLVLLGLFILVESRVAQPMIELGLFRNPDFSTSLIAGFIVFVAIDGVFVLMPFYLQDVLGFAPRLVGLLLAVSPIALGLTAPISGRLSDRFGSRHIMAIGLFVLTCGFYAISTLTMGTTIPAYILRLILIDTGMGLFEPPYASLIMGSVPPARFGVAAGLLHIAMALGNTVGIAVLGALWTARVSARLDRLPQSGATSAPAEIQMAALNDTYLIATFLIALALSLVVWNPIRSGRGRRHSTPAGQRTA